MKVATLAAIALMAIVMAAVLPVSGGTPVSSCPLTINVVEGSHVVLTASPAYAGYTYDWGTHPAGLTNVVHSGVGGGDGNIVAFNVPACGGPWEWNLMMKPTGEPGTCKAYCKITLTCTGLCPACPTIDNACIDETPTWKYDCDDDHAPASLFYEWYTQKDLLNPPVQGNMATWKQPAIISNNKQWSPILTGAAFNQPTEASPTADTWVTFVVRQDANGDSTPDTVMKFCTKKITLFYKPTTTMGSTVT
jgi:hypothetical protein